MAALLQAAKDLEYQIVKGGDASLLTLLGSAILLCLVRPGPVLTVKPRPGPAATAPAAA